MKYADVTARLCHPVAFATYAIAGAGLVLFAAAWIWRPFNLDDVQLLGIWLGVDAALFVLIGRWDRGAGRSTAAVGEPRPGTLHHQPIWIALIGALIFSFLQNYAEYLSLQDRLTQLHGDVLAQTSSVQEQLLHARYDAEILSDDLAEWTDTNAVDRGSLEVRVAADLTNLDGRTQAASTHLRGLVDRLAASAASPSGQTLSQSTLASVRNLADDAAQETRSLVQTFDFVDQSWQSGRAAPGAGERLQYAVNPRLWLAIDNASYSSQLLSDALAKATTVPVGDLFVVIAVLNLSCVLFPWLLLLLFVSGRRDMRLRQIYLDLWDLGGGTNEVLVRVLDRVDDNSLKADGYRKPEVRRALEDRTFSDIEYLLCLGVLTVLLTAGWHIVLYPTGALGLAQLVVNGVSVRDFAMYVAGNLNVVTLGFLGAYLYSAGVLIRRFFAYDLYPSAFLQMIYRVIIVFVISLVLTIFVPIATSVLPSAAKLALAAPFAGLPVAPNGGTPLDGTTALACGLAFFFGIWTPSFYLWIPRLVSSLPFGIDNGGSPQASIAQLEGVDLWVESRLNEEGIETVQAMATAAIERLVRRTYFNTARIVCWVDQALLYMHAGNGGQWMHAFRAAGIHKATDLIGAVGYATALRAREQAEVQVDLTSVRPAVETLVAAAASEADPKGAHLSAETIFEVCSSLWDEPNLVYVLNFYQAHRVDLRWAIARPTILNGVAAESSEAAVHA